jgi:hypothetical protein
MTRVERGTMHLKEIQTFLYRRITAPDSMIEREPGDVPAPLRTENVIRCNGGLRADRRIQIYVDAYFHRLLDCLKEDFPATLAVVQENVFNDLVRSYLVKYPPREPSIAYAGRYFAEFLHGHCILSRLPFLAELAQLERAILEVFLGQDCGTLSSSEMRTIAPECWPSFVVPTQPALQILVCKWKVSAIRRAVDNGTPWSEPTPEPTIVLVWRQDMQVYFRELETAEHAALKAASKGTTLATVCELLAEGCDEKETAAMISRVLARWLADGVLAKRGAGFVRGRKTRV